jgi:hypothetical protein
MEEGFGSDSKCELIVVHTLIIPMSEASLLCHLPCQKGKLSTNSLLACCSRELHKYFMYGSRARATSSKLYILSAIINLNSFFLIISELYGEISLPLINLHHYAPILLLGYFTLSFDSLFL